MPRIRDLKSLSSYRGKKITMTRPKSATAKAPDYVAFMATEKHTVTKGGKKVNVAAGTRMIYPEPGVLADRNICAMGKGKVGLRGCHVEFVLLGPKHAPSYGQKPGAYLRFCEKPNQKDARLVRVADHKEAQSISTAYCACRKKGGAAESCLPAPGLAGVRARRRR